MTTYSSASVNFILIRHLNFSCRFLKSLVLQFPGHTGVDRRGARFWSFFIFTRNVLDFSNSGFLHSFDRQGRWSEIYLWSIFFLYLLDLIYTICTFVKGSFLNLVIYLLVLPKVNRYSRTPRLKKPNLLLISNIPVWSLSS